MWFAVPTYPYLPTYLLTPTYLLAGGHVVPGMRGAVSFALAMTLEDTRTIHTMISLHKAPRIVTATLAAILFTNFAMAPFTKPLIGALRLGANSPPRRRGCRRRARRHGRRRAPPAVVLAPQFGQAAGGRIAAQPQEAEARTAAAGRIPRRGAAGERDRGGLLQPPADVPQLLLVDMIEQPLSLNGEMLLDSGTALPIFRSSIHRRCDSSTTALRAHLRRAAAVRRRGERRRLG